MGCLTPLEALHLREFTAKFEPLSIEAKNLRLLVLPGLRYAECCCEGEGERRERAKEGRGR